MIFMLSRTVNFKINYYGNSGLELASIMAADKVNLVLVARSADKLQQLKQELQGKHGVNIWVIVTDLSKDTAPEEVMDTIRREGIAIDYLVNNAGFGDFGDFAERGWDKINNMLMVNMVALTHLTHLLIPQLKASGNGKLMNIASTAAFQGGPNMAVYCATKAYVLSLSEALAVELKKEGITVTAFCPGATRSGFQDAAEMHGSRLVARQNIPSSAEVAKGAYRAMMSGKTTVIHGLMNKLLVFGERFMPRQLVTVVAGKMMAK
jgi:uncharacterized protein